LLTQERSEEESGVSPGGSPWGEEVRWGIGIGSSAVAWALNREGNGSRWTGPSIQGALFWNWRNKKEVEREVQ
jgi:hypothetical protein